MTQITEVLRYDPDENQIILHDIFNFRNGVSLRPTGYLPSFVDSLVEKELLDLEFLYGETSGAWRTHACDRTTARAGGRDRQRTRSISACIPMQRVTS